MKAKMSYFMSYLRHHFLNVMRCHEPEVEIFEPISWRRLWGWDHLNGSTFFNCWDHADSWEGTGSCIPPLRLRTAAARHWMFFFQAFWMASTWKRDVWREIVGKASELRVCIYVYMWLCACVWEQTFSLMQWNHCVCVCVSGTNWTHTLLDGAADMYPVANLQCTIFPLTEALPGKACPKRSTIASLRLLILPLFSHLVATWWSATVWALLWIDLIS